MAIPKNKAGRRSSEAVLEAAPVRRAPCCASGPIPDAEKLPPLSKSSRAPCVGGNPLLHSQNKWPRLDAKGCPRLWPFCRASKSIERTAMKVGNIGRALKPDSFPRAHFTAATKRDATTQKRKYGLASKWKPNSGTAFERVPERSQWSVWNNSNGCQAPKTRRERAQAVCGNVRIFLGSVLGVVFETYIVFACWKPKGHPKGLAFGAQTCVQTRLKCLLRSRVDPFSTFPNHYFQAMPNRCLLASAKIGSDSCK